ncbi:MAG: VOC family protein [Patescibacteria group bacterium]
MQKIVPHLWFDKEAKEAAEFYTTVFPNSKITKTSVLHDTPSGDCDVVSFSIWGYSFMSISAGPYFKLNPSISFVVNFDPAQDSKARNRIDIIWEKLMDGGEALMPLDTYPFCERYGWVKDKYGVSWQLVLTDSQDDKRPFIIPDLMFVNNVYGKAEEAKKFYISVFKNAPNGDAKHGTTARYHADREFDKKGTIKFTEFTLAGQWFDAMDSGYKHKFNFNEAISFIVNCADQKEIDYYWGKLSAVPESEQCGWLKDKYGVSWQIVPKQMDEMMDKGTPEQIARVTEAFLKMKKFDIAKLQKAYEGE